jgi:hypothetical protein
LEGEGMIDLTLVVVGKDDADATSFPMPDCIEWCNQTEGGTHILVFGNNCGTPLSVLANRELNRYESEVFGLCHADVVFGRGALEAFIVEAMRGAVCGIVGADLTGALQCCYTAGRAVPSDVSTLDGMAVFFRADLGLSFDEQTFDGFHCHVEDLCLQAHARGIPVTVPAADAHHRNHTQSQAWLADYQMYRKRLAEKWKDTVFRTT